MPEQYRKKPVVIEAVRWTGCNPDDMVAFMGTKHSLRRKDCAGPNGGRMPGGELIIETLEDGADKEAIHVASPGDWIIKGVAGEFYPCKPDIFAATYEPAGASSTSVAQPEAEKPKIICLCGSTRFIETWINEYQRLSDAGNIVLTVARMPPRPTLQHDQPELKVRLDELHKRKIDLADEVFVLNVGGYIGSSTKGEIDYAIAHGKPVIYLESGASTVPPSVAETPKAALRSAENFHADPVEQLAFELAFELEEAELSPTDLVTVNRDKLRAIAERVISRLRASGSTAPDRTIQDSLTVAAPVSETAKEWRLVWEWSTTGRTHAAESAPEDVVNGCLKVMTKALRDQPNHPIYRNVRRQSSVDGGNTWIDAPASPAQKEEK